MLRFIGIVLVLFGILLCFTIIAAPFGIFLMILGTVLCLIPGRRRTIINNVVQVSATPGPAFQQANLPEMDERSLRGRREPPALNMNSEPPMRSIESARVLDVAPAHVNPRGYDEAKWSALVRYDEDISRIVTVLAPYGQKYVDELARAYLTLNDKSYLPMIIDKIIVSARQDAAMRTQ